MDDYLQRAASNISRKDQELLRKIEQPKNREKELGVDNAEIDYDNIVLSKRSILNAVLKIDNNHENRTLVDLFKTYFTEVDEEYTRSDLMTILTQQTSFAKFPSNLEVKKKKYKKNNKTYYIHFEDETVIVGASNAAKGIWFVFTNEKSDVNNGSIYIRNNRISTIKLYSTFEINAYSIGKSVVTDPVTGIAELKDKITFHPSWLRNTISNMEKHIFQNTP